MPITKPSPFASDEEWEAYFTKKGASQQTREQAKKTKPEHKRGRGIYKRTAKHRLLQREIQNKIHPKSRKKRSPSRRKSRRWLMDIEVIRSICEDVTGISTILTIRITPGEPREVRQARSLEWYMIWEYARKNTDEVAMYYGLKWWDVAIDIKRYKAIARQKGKMHWHVARIRKQIDAASAIPKRLRSLTFQKKVRVSK